jgi:hypothetical protein
MKIKKFSLIFWLLLLPNALFAQIWEIREFKDSFGDGTGEKLVAAIFRNNNNTLTMTISKGECFVTVFNGSSRAFFTRPIIRLRNSNKVTLAVECSNSGNGSISFNYGTHSESDSLFASLLSVDKYGFIPDLIEFLKPIDKIRISIEGGITTYNFEVDTTGFAEVYSKL